MNKKQINILIIAIGGLVLFIAGGFSGYTFCKRAQYKGVIKQQAKDAKTVLKHIDKKAKVKKNVDTIIEEKVLRVIDPSGCLDTGSPGNYLDGLLSADSAAKSGFN